MQTRKFGGEMWKSGGNILLLEEQLELNYIVGVSSICIFKAILIIMSFQSVF